jgi:hypothetical protein
MKCKCGNELKIAMISKAKCEGCEMLASITSIVTVKCLNCNEVLQIPISSSDYIMKENVE